ncbi:MAG: sigma-70 family RNA polymerase sigma factor [Planctomycetota bacterium]|nr:sigma-70 family RNA polymerase sigma factor [Planctomycetota bacterium]
MAEPTYPADPAAAVERLVTDHGGRLYAIASRLCGCAEEAEDLVQEVFLQAFRKWSQFEGRARPLTWLYTIAARACQRMHRKRSGEPDHLASFDDLLPFVDGALPSVHQQEGGPLAEQIRKEGIERVKAGILALPLEFRLPLVLKEVVGLSMAEVARVLGIKPATAKTRVHRARLRIRKELEGAMVSLELPPTAYERQVCLDLLAAKQEALDHGEDLGQTVICGRCREVFASLDYAHDTCARLAEGELPKAVRERVLEAIRRESAGG